MASMGETGAQLRNWIRDSSLRTAAFLIAVFYFTEYQAQVAAWIWSAVTGDVLLEAPESRDLLTWGALVYGLNSLFNRALWFVGGYRIDDLFRCLTCVVAIAWLHASTLRASISKLGLPRPKRVEFTIPIIATIPVFVVAFIVLESTAGPRDEAFRYMGESISGFVPSFAALVTYGFLYRGLLEDAGWSKNRSLLALLAMVVVIPTIPVVLHDLDFFGPWRLISGVAAGAAFVLLNTWLYLRWRRRVWVLVVLAYAQQLIFATLPSLYRIDSNLLDSLIYALSWSPILLLALWTLVAMRRDSSGGKLATSLS